MDLKKGLIRIVVLGVWLFFCVKLGLAMLELFGLTNTYDVIVDFLTIFAIGFFIPAPFILIEDSGKAPDEQFFDSDDFSTKVTLIVSIITGFICLAIHSRVRPAEPHAGAYLMAFLNPFILIFSIYLYVLWIADGFRKII